MQNLNTIFPISGNIGSTNKADPHFEIAKTQDH